MNQQKYKEIGRKYLDYHYPDIEDVTIIPFKHELIGDGISINFVLNDYKELPSIPCKYVRMIENGISVKGINVPYLTEDKFGYEYPIKTIYEKQTESTLYQDDVSYIIKKKILNSNLTIKEGKPDKGGVFVVHRNNSNYLKFVPNEEIKDRFYSEDKLVGIKRNNNDEFKL